MPLSNPPKAVDEAMHAQLTTDYTTASLAATASEDVTDLTITFTANYTGPYELECGFESWRGNANSTKPQVRIMSGATVLTRAGFEAGAEQLKRTGARPLARVSLTANTQYTYKVNLINATGATTGTLTVFADATYPFWLRARPA